MLSIVIAIRSSRIPKPLSHRSRARTIRSYRQQALEVERLPSYGVSEVVDVGVVVAVGDAELGVVVVADATGSSATSRRM